MKFRNLSGPSQSWMAVALILASVIPATAQTTPTTPTTCTTAPTSLSALNIERAILPADSHGTGTPNTPANVRASVTAGAQETREILIYNPQQGTVTSTEFLVAAGAPLPTPNFNFQTGVLQSTTIKISQVLAGCNPAPSVLLVGTVSDSSATGSLGNVNGSPAVISLGYTTDTPPQINNVAEIIAGKLVTFSASALGTLTFPATPVVPPGSNGGVNIVVTSPQLGPLAGGVKVIQVNQNPLLLDASKSTGSGALTFTWGTTGQPVGLHGTGTPGQILVTFPGKGDFTINLTVTDSAGVSQQFTMILEYSGG